MQLFSKAVFRHVLPASWISAQPSKSTPKSTLVATTFGLTTMLAYTGLNGLVSIPAQAELLSQPVSNQLVPNLVDVAQALETVETLPTSSIVPELPGGTATIVTPTDSGFNITGGTTSRDGQNLFHSFETFDLGNGDTANFVTPASIENVVGRIFGGDVSVIDGVLQVSGSLANLYIINPAGIVFGPNVQLNLPANFTATTADGIDFGATYLSATESNRYLTLNGDPTGYTFSTPTPAAIENQGNLAVGVDQTLLLIGGSVQNTGTLTAPSGTVALAAVPGENRVRLAPINGVLNLEIEALPNLQSTDLPALLTGGNTNSATQLVTNADGSTQLVGAATDPVAITPGTVVVRGDINVSGTTGGDIYLWGTDISVISSTLSASGTRQGGTIHIGGKDTTIEDILTAEFVFINRGSILSATSSDGDGGLIYVWADDTTTFYGQTNVSGDRPSANGSVSIGAGETLDIIRPRARR
jgi:filamentous hemagglutinin family protein